MRNIKQKDHPLKALEYRCVDSKYQSKVAPKKLKTGHVNHLMYLHEMSAKEQQTFLKDLRERHCLSFEEFSKQLKKTKVNNKWQLLAVFKQLCKV